MTTNRGRWCPSLVIRSTATSVKCQSESVSVGHGGGRTANVSRLDTSRLIVVEETCSRDRETRRDEYGLEEQRRIKIAAVEYLLE
ncbi:hypothetical protein A0H81_00319 [Grifola frondosa]|uniref:Uncharacterized protein n=1 Tax=Grifola frondosa TaxID=5627 RepID=A0A1C7MSG2_GRIFR|nr:hypothetical protein A0H81_00319 [Grifola frondosa]